MVPAPTLELDRPGGRVLAADVVGDVAGRPVLHLHGAPDCRLARHPDDGLAAAAGVRLVAVDRPGWGASSPLIEVGPAALAAWVADAVALLDHLGIGRAGVAAWSAGAPWAFALAAGAPERVAAVATYGAVAPFEALGPDADPAVAGASGARAGMAAMVRDGLTPGELADEVAPLLLPPSPVDRALARDLVVEGLGPGARAELATVPGLLDQLARSLAASVARHGDAGLRADLAVQFADGLAEVLAGVRCPVLAVHGEHDGVAGPPVGAWLVAHLPRAASARAETWAGRGHQGLLVEWSRWLEAVTTAG